MDVLTFDTIIRIGGPLFTNHIIDIGLLAAGLDSIYTADLSVPEEHKKNVHWSTGPLTRYLEKGSILSFWDSEYKENRFSELETYLVKEDIYFRSYSIENNYSHFFRRCIFRPGIDRDIYIVNETLFKKCRVPTVKIISCPTYKCMLEIYEHTLGEFII